MGIALIDIVAYIYMHINIETERGSSRHTEVVGPSMCLRVCVSVAVY